MNAKSLKTKSEFEIILETRSMLNNSLELLHHLEKELIYKVSKQKNLQLYEMSVDCDTSYLIEEIKIHEKNVSELKLKFASSMQEAKRFSIDNILKL